MHTANSSKTSFSSSATKKMVWASTLSSLLGALPLSPTQTSYQAAYASFPATQNPQANDFCDFYMTNSGIVIIGEPGLVDIEGPSAEVVMGVPLVQSENRLLIAASPLNYDQVLQRSFANAVRVDLVNGQEYRITIAGQPDSRAEGAYNPENVTQVLFTFNQADINLDGYTDSRDLQRFSELYGIYDYEILNPVTPDGTIEDHTVSTKYKTNRGRRWYGGDGSSFLANYMDHQGEVTPGL